MDPMDVALSRPRWPTVVARGQLTPSTLVDPDAARTLIGKLNEQFEIVIVVSAPIHLSGNALVWAKAVSLVVLAVERDRASATTSPMPWRIWRGSMLRSSARSCSTTRRARSVSRRQPRRRGELRSRTPSPHRAQRPPPAPDEPARGSIPLGLRTRVFWASAAVVGYTYVGFPLLVLARSRLRPAPYRSGEITPTVTLLIAAHNEARAIGAKLDNALALDYPADRPRDRRGLGRVR